MVFGLLEKDVLCAIVAVTTTMGVDLGFSWVFLGFFLGCFLLIFYHIAAKTKITEQKLSLHVICSIRSPAPRESEGGSLGK